MKTTSHSRRSARRFARRFILATTFALAFAACSIRASTLYWDPDAVPAGNDTGSGAGLGGTGTWDTTALNWFDGVSSDAAWSNGGDDAVFTGASGTVTVDAAINAQSISFPNTTGSYTLTNTINGSITLGATIDSGASDQTIGVPIGGAAGLTKNGVSVLTLAGANNYSGPTVVTAGTLRSGAPGIIPDSSAVTLSTGATLDLSSLDETIGSLADAGNVALGSATLTTGGDGSSTTYSGVISGTGGLTKLGPGTMVLNGGNTFTGPTTISEGTLQYAAANRIGNSSAVVVATGATFDMNGFSDTVGSLAGSGSVNLGAGTLTFGGDNTSTTWSGSIGGTGAIAKNGTGVTTFSSANTYSGKTTINAGTLAIGNNDNRLGTPPGSATLLLTLNGGTLQNSGSVTLNANRNISLGANGGTFETVSGTLTSAAVVSGAGTLNKIGAGTLRLTGANTMTGPVNITAGVLSIDSSTSFGTTSTSGIFIDGATLRNSSTAAGGTFITVNRPIAIGSNGATFDISGVNGILVYNGVLSGAGNTLTKIGVGEFRALQNWTFSKLVVNQGLYRINGTGGGETGFGAVPATFMPDAITLNGGVVGTSVGITTPATRGITLGVKGGTFALSASWTINSPITGPGALILFTNEWASSSSLSLTLGGTNTYEGPTIINGGTIVLSAAGALPTNTAVVMNSNPDFVTIGMTVSQNNTAASLSGGSSTNGVLSISNNRTFTVGDTNDTTFVGSVTGAGRFVKRGTGTLTTGLHDWSNTGTTTISEGTLKFGDSATGLGNSSAVTIASGATLDMNSFNDTLGSLAGGGTIINGGNLTLGGSATADFSGSYAGTGTLTKGGSGQQTLSGANSFASVTVNSGALLVNSAGGAGSGAVTVNSGGTLGGTGVVPGPVALNPGGNIGAGASAGLLTLGTGLALSAGGTNTWELAANSDTNPGTDFDQIAITGGNLLLGGTSRLAIKFIGTATSPDLTNTFWQAPHQWTVISLSGPAVNPGSSNFSAIDGTEGITAGTFSSSVDASGSIILAYTPNTGVPPTPVTSMVFGPVSGGSCSLFYSGGTGTRFVLVKSDNVAAPLSSWSRVDTNTAPSGSFTIGVSSDPAAFYRVKSE
jgi:fibronectin-binding autotransporter adhesin